MTDHILVQRRDFTQATLDRFMNKPFEWGVTDCARIVAFHLRQFGMNPGLAKAGQYSTAIGARRALGRLGVSSLADHLDRMLLPRIPPASAILGDIIGMPSEGEMDALAVALGNGAILGFMEGADVVTTMRAVRYEAAWRVTA